MNLTAPSSNILSALDFVMDCVERRTTIPILSHVLIRAENGKATIAASDLDRSAMISVDCESNEPVAFTIPAEKLNTFVRTSRGDTLKASISSQWATMQCGGSRMRVPTEKPAAFAMLPEKPSEDALTKFPVAWFRRNAPLVRKVALAGKEDQQIGRLQCEAGKWSLMSFDGKRLVVAEAQSDEQVECVFQIPAKFIKDMEKSTDGARLAIGDTLLVLMDDREISSRLLHCAMKDMRGVASKAAFTASAKVSTADLKRAIEACRMMADGLSVGVVLKTRDGQLVVSKNTATGEEFENGIVVLESSGETEFEMDWHFIQDWCASGCDFTIIESRGHNGTVRFTPSRCPDGETLAYYAQPLYWQE